MKITNFTKSQLPIKTGNFCTTALFVVKIVNFCGKHTTLGGDVITNISEVGR